MYRACKDCRNCTPQDHDLSLCEREVTMLRGDIQYGTTFVARSATGNCGPDVIHFEHIESPPSPIVPALILGMLAMVIGIGALVALAVYLR